jgi:hypothetical protein
MNPVAPYKPYDQISWYSLANELSLEIGLITRSSDDVNDDRERLLTPNDIEFLKEKAGCHMGEGEWIININEYMKFLTWWIPVTKTISLLRNEFVHSTPLLIQGFIGKNNATNILSNTNLNTTQSNSLNGMCMIRFSDTKPGYLSLVVSIENQVKHWLIQVKENGQIVLQTHDSKAADIFPNLKALLTCKKYSKLKTIHPGIAIVAAFKDL